MSSSKITYKDAGVDTEKGQHFVKNITNMVHSTYNKNVLGGLGGFAAAYDVSFLKDYKNPIMLSGTDGVGTKLVFARLLDRHDTIGIDLVAMCVNDLLVLGGKTLFFQDYIACGKLNLERMESIVSGIVKGCTLASASLVGGETAEHPGVMDDDEYDLAGFAVGVVEKDEIIDGSTVNLGDHIIGIASSGPHSNGFSLLRKLLLENGKLPNDSNKLKIIENFVLTPTTIYVPYILKLLEKHKPKGMVHITGGGFYENIPRILQKGQGAELQYSLFPKLEFYERIQKDFSLEKETLFSTFNMGVGFIVIVSPEDSESVLYELRNQGLDVSKVGTITDSGQVLIK
ncbi:phosphoribosylformylglycinamidine cyclo-ligase [Leptospira sp. GIMC2001]|uniref:phosphoribosylformylglycinamidine cyclo-ligase n=1 Tax=Leptospira sp. GIMC2001 TaxID=1513297 RepID=UPI00234A6A98|nr:phosphoribosylformylglycinamidine cyclo-ligase [Leptospira sp. GIMC2001]WCL50263.1 phosphoribosylformylglycinamidine cyclo-ligase [Leptospira sp. GIMC2001]